MKNPDAARGPFRLELTADEALVLFEWLSQLEDQSGSEPDSAEALVHAKMLAHLESTLTSPFAADYGAIVEAARERLRDSR
jgi:hypothetical protein